MKNILLITILMLSFAVVQAQPGERKTRKERKAEKELKKAEKINQLLNDGAFVFDATHALPMGGGSRYLNYDYDVTINNDSINSYLPFFGVAYRAEYGSTDSPFDFQQPLEAYNLEQEDDGDGYILNLEVDKGIDHLNYTFHIAENGNATLHVTSTNRQSISYYGNIHEIKKEE